MILQGELKDFSLADLLQLLLQQHKSGTLMLTREKEKAEITLSQGNIIGVKVGGLTPETRIRDMLVESGKISRKEMGDLEAVSVNMNRPLLATLSAKGYLPEEERERVVAVASEDMVFDLFRWTEGNYEFGGGQKGMAPGLGHLRISTEFACMEGMRRIDEWPRLQEQVPHDRMVFQRTDRVCDSEDVWEQGVLVCIDGRLPISAIAKRQPFGYFRLLECLVNLWDAGCIAPLEGAALPVEAPSVADPRVERDQKTALVLGLSAMLLIAALVFRLVATWFLQSTGVGAVNTPQTRAEAAALRENAAVMVLDHLSRTGTTPKRLGDLAQEGQLAGYETRGPEGRQLNYQTLGDKDFVLK